MPAGTLEILEQPRLPLNRQIEICADGIRHRFFRSMTTLAVVTLAVAFLMNMLAESVIVRSCKRGITGELSQLKQLSHLMSLTEMALEKGALRNQAALAVTGSLPSRILQNWSGMHSEDFEKFRRQCVEVEAMQAWLDGLKLGHRRLLFRDIRVDEGLRRLTEPEQWEQFEKRLQRIPSLRRPDKLEAVVKYYPAFEEKLAAALEGVEVAINRLRTDLKGRSLKTWLAKSATDAEESASVSTFLASHGVELTPLELSELCVQARNQVNLNILMNALSIPEVKPAWINKFERPFSLAKALRYLADDSSTGRWLINFKVTVKVKDENEQKPDKEKEITSVRDRLIAAGLDPEEVPKLASRILHVQKAETLQDQLVAEYGREEGIGANALWLVVVSLVVCVVGITNAMLVSVIERFREIATMKCLGAMDGLIATLFLLEAAFLGFIGGLAGVFIGSLVGLLRMFVSFGSWVWTFFPPVDMLVVAGLSILAGLVLTTFASIYPAFRAARMAPMEAMRVE